MNASPASFCTKKEGSRNMREKRGPASGICRTTSSQKTRERRERLAWGTGGSIRQGQQKGARESGKGKGRSGRCGNNRGNRMAEQSDGQ